MNSTECYSIEELQKSLDYIKKRKAFYTLKQELLAKNIKTYTEDLQTLTDRLALIESAKQYYLKVVDMRYIHSIQEMEQFVNHVLGYVFYDEDYRLRLDISNKYNKSITFYLYDGKKDLELPLRKGNGKGVKAVVSFVLLTYYLLRVKSPYLFMDEAFVNISQGYVQRFFEYIRLLCNKHDMCIVLITHDTRFPEYADVVYSVKKGVVTKRA